MKENLTSVGFEPTTSGLDPPMLYGLSYEASAGAGRCNLGSESQTLTTHNANRHCSVRLCTFVGRPLSKQSYPAGALTKKYKQV